MPKLNIENNIVKVDGKNIVFDCEVESLVIQSNCLCILLNRDEDNLICTDLSGKERWRNSDLYKKSLHVKQVSQVGPKLIKAVWDNGDIKVINSLKGEIYS